MAPRLVHRSALTLPAALVIAREGVGGAAMSGPDRIVARIRKNSRESLIVALASYGGTDLASIRAWVMDGNKPSTPTKAGLGIRLQLLPDVIAALLEVERLARAEGLL